MVLLARKLVVSRHRGDMDSEPVLDAAPQGAPLPGISEVYWERFTILAEIGRQGEGRVYKARDAQTGRLVGLWVMPPGSVLDEAGLSREVEKLTGVAHKNLVELYGLAQDGGTTLIWMEYVGGELLSELLARKRKAGQSVFSLKGAYNLAAHVLAACSSLHPGAFHGRISPRCIVIDGRGRVKLFGAGIMRHLAGPSDEPYLAPEPELGPWSDIYSVGVLLLELLTGNPSRERISLLPAPLREVLARAIDPDPEARYQSPDALRHALSTASREAVRERNGQSEPRVSISPRAAVDDPAPKPPVTPVPTTEGPGPAGPLVPPPEAPGLEAPRRSRSLIMRAFAKLKAPEAEAIWLARRDGLDYGPFTQDQLVERVRSGEFDESTMIQNLQTGQTKKLLEFQEFKAPLERLVRERAALAQEQEAIRARQLQTAKKAGKGVMFLVFLGVALFVGATAAFIYWEPTPKPLLYEETMLGLGHPIRLPEIEPAAKVAQRIRREREAKEAKRRRAKAIASLNYVPGDARTLGSDEEFARSVQRVDFSGGGGGGRALSDAEVDRVIRTHWGGFSRCVANEVKRNPGLESVTLSFWVKGDGRPGGIKIQSNGTKRMFRCLRKQIMALRFREHGGPPKKVLYPLQIAR